MRSIIFCLTVAALAALAAPTEALSQENKIDFTWLNRSEQMLAGTVRTALKPKMPPGTYEVEFAVTWFDQNGQPIPESGPAPFLFLSTYDLDLEPSGKITCSTFSGSAKEIVFSSTGRLSLEIAPGYNGEIRLFCRFQYALSRELIARGQLEKISLPEGKTAVFSFIMGQTITGNASDLTERVGGRDRNTRFQTASYRILLGQYQNYHAQLQDFHRRKSNEGISTRIQQLRDETDPKIQQAGLEEAMGIAQLYLNDLDNLIAGFNSVRILSPTDSLPADTVRSFTARFNKLSDEIQSLRSDYYQYSLLIKSLQPVENELNRSKLADSIRQTARKTYITLFQRQYDSLLVLVINLDSLRFKVIPLIRKGSARQSDLVLIDSLMIQHESIKADFSVMRLVHQQSWIDYRSLILGIQPVNEVENLHEKYTSLQNETENKFLETENLVRDARNQALARRDFSSRWYFWGGIIVAGLLILVSFLRFFQLKRFRYNQIPSGDLAGNGNLAGTAAGSLAGPGIFDETDSVNGFYSVDYSTVLTETVVARIHFSPSAIKSVYQLVHGAFMEKKGGSFGGYFFGSYYKINVEGLQKYELVVDRVSSSTLIRPDVPNNMEFNADLVDEMNEQVKQNKKSILLGWFTSSVDSGLEMPEGIQKMHRTFFKEKWQIGLLINPGSEELNSACFMRRKTGYFESFPDPGAFLKWEELYRYSMNPVPDAGLKAQVQKASGDFVPFALNSSWCDSIVNRVHFDKPVLKEMQNASALQASPMDNFQVVGYIYGSASRDTEQNQKEKSYEVFAERFIELSNEAGPREIPGLQLIGWLGQGKSDMFEFIGAALSYQEQFFREPYQVACLLNSQTGEFRIFSRKNNLEMNNSTIETEEFRFNDILSTLD